MSVVETIDRMIAAVPDYYQYSSIYRKIQEAVGTEYYNREESNNDLMDQLYVVTATWGLKYWEESLGLPVSESENYEKRRGLVLSALRGTGNFSASLLKSIGEGFGEIPDVALDLVNFELTLTFNKGVPTWIDDYIGIVDNLVHAHFGILYEFIWKIETTIGTNVEYARYRYDFLICGTFDTGTEPEPAILGRSETDNLGIQETLYLVTKDYNLCGTFNCGEVTT